MKSCSSKIFKLTRYFHIFSILVIIIGTSINMYASFKQYYTGFWLPVALSVMIFFRLPNQICVAHKHSDGWLSVIGSLIGLLSYIATIIIIVDTHTQKDSKDSKCDPNVDLKGMMDPNVDLKDSKVMDSKVMDSKDYDKINQLLGFA